MSRCLVAACCFLLASGSGPTHAAPPVCPHEEVDLDRPLTDQDVYLSQARALWCLQTVGFYVMSRILSGFSPAYTFGFDDGGSRHGLLWELAYEVQAGGWRHTAFASVALYPEERDVAARVGYRLRLLSLDLYRHYGVHLYLGAGGHLGHLGVGPRVEARLRFGWIEPAGGGLFVASAWEPDLRDGVAGRGEASAGLEFHF